MASAAAGSFDAVVRTTASSAAVDGVARASGAAPAASAKDSKSSACGSGDPSSSARFASTSVTCSPSRQRAPRWPTASPGAPARCAGTAPRTRPARPPTRVPGFPATVKGVREQMTPDNRLRQHLVNPLSVHRRTLIRVPRRASTGRPGPASGHNQGVLSLVCFVAGGLLGLGCGAGRAARSQRVWPVVLRVQILVTSATLSLVAAWRLTSAGQLLGPARPGRRAVAACSGRPWRTRGRRSAGEAALEAWAVSPNSGFWVVPAATAFAGSDRDDDRRPGQRASRPPGAPWRST